MDHRDLQNHDVVQIEEKLKQVFNSIKPDPYYVNKLRERLSRRANVSVEEHPEYFVIVLIGMGLFFGFGLYWLLVNLYRKARGK